MGYWNSDSYNDLAGVKVTGLQKPFQQGDEQIVFLCENGKSFTLDCEGDCCSHSWFEHMELPAFPFTILSAEEVNGVDLPESSYEDNYEWIQTYGLKMTTDKGYVDIDMRNSSNGYYGGTFELNTEGLK